jgi:tRNA(His) 5'-end guanylyltransferase
VIRVDGRGFHRFSEAYNFTKPNDIRAIKLMNAAAVSVVKAFPDICIGYGACNPVIPLLCLTTLSTGGRGSRDAGVSIWLGSSIM